MSTRSHIHEETFDASPETLFELLHTPSAIRGWWGASRAVVLPEEGGTWVAVWGEEDDPDYVTVATIRAFEPPRRMVLTDYRYRAKTGPLPFEADFTTEFLVIAQGSGAVLRVTQEGFPAGAEADYFYAGCQQGWRDTFRGIRAYLNELASSDEAGGATEEPTRTPADIYPGLTYEDASGAIEWLEEAFGFTCRLRVEGPEGTVRHSELSLGTGVIMVGSPRPDDGRRSPRQLAGVNQVLSVYVEDPDGHCARARAAGATILQEPQDEPHDARGYLARDPEGHLWYFGTYRPGAYWQTPSADAD